MAAVGLIVAETEVVIKTMAKWCNLYNCWCDEAEGIAEYEGDCSYECNHCDDCEEVEYKD